MRDWNPIPQEALQVDHSDQSIYTSVKRKKCLNNAKRSRIVLTIKFCVNNLCTRWIWFILWFSWTLKVALVVFCAGGLKSVLSGLDCSDCVSFWATLTWLSSLTAGSSFLLSYKISDQKDIDQHSRSTILKIMNKFKFFFYIQRYINDNILNECET